MQVPNYLVLWPDNKPSAIMHYHIYFNQTHSEVDGSWWIYEILFSFELVVLICSYFPLNFMVLLMLRTHPFHFNVKVIWIYLAGEYNTQLTFRIWQIILTFQGLQDSQEYLVTSLIKATCYFVVSFILPTLVLERLCASYFLKDYERRRRAYISFTILIFITVIGVFLAWEFHKVSSTLWMHVGILVLNFIFSIINVYIEKYNQKRLLSSMNLRKGRKEYSLAERFQIAENLRTCEMLRVVINTVSIFNLVSTVMISLDNFGLPISYDNVAVTIFSYCTMTYGAMMQYIFFKYTTPFHAESKKIFRMIFRSKSVDAVSRPLTPNMLKLESEKRTNDYFDQLQKQWNTPPS